MLVVMLIGMLIGQILVAGSIKNQGRFYAINTVQMVLLPIGSVLVAIAYGRETPVLGVVFLLTAVACLALTIWYRRQAKARFLD